MNKIELNETWLNGKYHLSGNFNEASEINTSLPYISIPKCSHSNMIISGDFFVQGDEAWNVISEIYIHWLKNDCTQSESLQTWINNNL